MAIIRTRQSFYDLFITELQAQETSLTDDSEGSLVDILAGLTSEVMSELSLLTLDEFAKTFFDSADGPEITGGPDDLQTLAVDHFGDEFERPLAVEATGEVTFSRAAATAGICVIPAGTVVQTAANANGEKTRFLTSAEVTMLALGLTVIAEVEAETAGVDGNVDAATVVEIETTLTDPTITVSNVSAMAGGSDTETDAEYRETIRSLIKAISGATLVAIRAKALTVPGIASATAVEQLKTVIEYDIATDDIAVGAEYFQMPYVYLYVADANGVASPTLLAAVETAVDSVRAAGVKIVIEAADAVELNWTAAITLNVAGPNYATLQSDTTQITDSMSAYLNNLATGTDFIRVTANAALLAIWGPAGTNDITAFTTTLPVGDVAVAATDKIVPGTVAIA